MLLTGDGHFADILKGLEHNGLLKEGKGLHVDVLKVQHHGSEHNFKREFAKRITADHYVICGNGRTRIRICACSTCSAVANRQKIRKAPMRGSISRSTSGLIAV